MNEPAGSQVKIHTILMALALVVTVGSGLCGWGVSLLNRMVDKLDQVTLAVSSDEVRIAGLERENAQRHIDYVASQNKIIEQLQELNATVSRVQGQMMSHIPSKN